MAEPWDQPMLWKGGQMTFMGACRQREGDRDKLDKVLRVLRAAYMVALLQSFMWFTDAASKFVRGAEPVDESLLHILGPVALMFLVFVSFGRAEAVCQGLRRPLLLPLLTTVLLAAAETTTFLGWWAFHPMLGQWRPAVAVALGALLILRLGERTVLHLRSSQSAAALYPAKTRDD